MPLQKRPSLQSASTEQSAIAVSTAKATAILANFRGVFCAVAEGAQVIVAGVDLGIMLAETRFEREGSPGSHGCAMKHDRSSRSRRCWLSIAAPVDRCRSRCRRRY